MTPRTLQSGNLTQLPEPGRESSLFEYYVTTPFAFCWHEVIESLVWNEEGAARGALGSPPVSQSGRKRLASKTGLPLSRTKKRKKKNKGNK